MRHEIESLRPDQQASIKSSIETFRRLTRSLDKRSAVLVIKALHNESSDVLRDTLLTFLLEEEYRRRFEGANGSQSLSKVDLSEYEQEFPTKAELIASVWSRVKTQSRKRATTVDKRNDGAESDSFDDLHQTSLTDNVQETLDTDVESIKSGAADAKIQSTLNLTSEDRQVDKGDCIGPYRMLDTLGEGGMGTVYLAEQREPVTRQVALKVIRQGLQTKEVIARFEAERQALAMMDHPSIAKVLDAGTTPNGAPFFVMELVRGISLTKYCDRKRLDIDQRLELFRQVCLAVQHAHSKGIIHRDLKPSNILVAEVNGKPIPKIIDFGVAKALHQKLTDRTMFTAHGQVLGTLEYMSPEQAFQSEVDVDTRSDIYSLGVILFELLTGSTPIRSAGKERPSFGELLDLIRVQEAPRPSIRFIESGDAREEISSNRGTDQRKLLGLLRSDLDWIVIQTLEKDRTRRYSSADALATDIECYQKCEPVTARPHSLAYRTRKFIRRRKGLSIAASLLLLTLIGGGVFSSAFAIRERKAKNEILQLSDRTRLANAQRKANELWPPLPNKSEELKAWLDVYEPLANRLALHKETLEKLRSDADSKPNVDPQSKNVESGGANWKFNDQELQWRHDALKDLVQELEHFNDPDPHRGLVASVRERIEFSTSIRQRSIESEEAQKAWSEVLEQIDTAERYQESDFSLEPQIGLYPLGFDPESQLAEFLHLQSHEGALPERDKDGALAITEKTGIILVLMPGGVVPTMADEYDYGINTSLDMAGLRVEFVSDEGLFGAMGVRQDDIIVAINGEPVGEDQEEMDLLFIDVRLEEVDLELTLIRNEEEQTLSFEFAQMVPFELPVENEVEAFFISKYELNQAQYLRMSGDNPSEYPPPEWEVTPLHPVEFLDWNTADLVLSRNDLRMPGDPEWHFAAIGDDNGDHFWTGDEASSLEGKANIADRSALRAGFQWFSLNEIENENDGYPIHAPVDTFPANPNGLHHVHGNVAEWLDDSYDDRGVSEMSKDEGQLYQTQIGGSYFSTPYETSPWNPLYTTPQTKDDDLGVRPARSIR